MERTARLRRELEHLWDEEAGTYLAQHLDRVPIRHRTVLSLLALFAGGLPPEHAAALAADISDPSRFSAPWPLPTVAMDDPAFDPEDMWRGPTWVNTNYLVAEGLERCGHAGAAQLLRTQTLDGLAHARAPVEYYNPLSGAPARTATVSFGWSAALFVDLAVREAAAHASQRGAGHVVVVDNSEPGHGTLGADVRAASRLEDPL